MAEALQVNKEKDLEQETTKMEEEQYRLPPPLKDQNFHQIERKKELNEAFYKTQRVLETLESLSDLKDPEVEFKLAKCIEQQAMIRLELEQELLTAEEDLINKEDNNNKPLQEKNNEQDAVQEEIKTITKSKDIQNIKKYCF